MEVIIQHDQGTQSEDRNQWLMNARLRHLIQQHPQTNKRQVSDGGILAQYITLSKQFPKLHRNKDHNRA